MRNNWKRWAVLLLAFAAAFAMIPTAAAASAPAITKQPVSVTASVGTAVKFSVTAKGTGLTYRWQYSDDGANWKNCVSETNDTATFSFKASTALNGRQYRCAVTGSGGLKTYSSAAKLTVTATKVTKQPVSVTASAGTAVKFSVTAKGTGLTYRWQYSDDGANWKNCVSETNDTAAFSFKAGTALNGRQYRCAVTGSDGVKIYSAAAKLTVTATEVTKQPVSVAASAGDAVKFSVTAKGTGLAYRWQYSDDGANWKNCVSETNDTAAFSFKAGTALNGRQYRCAVTGSDGVKIYSAAAKLTVTTTKITKHPGAEKVTVGDTAVFIVSATGTGIKYQWQYSADGGRTWSDMSGDSAKTARLSFTVTSSNHGRQYRCAITGSDGVTLYTDTGGETYIDVSLTNQTLKYYVNGSLSLSTPIITGKPGSETPTGTYMIRSYSKDTALYPSDGTGPYYVDYWIGWDRTGNIYGFHDAQWKAGPFGGDTYKTDGSHGCVNLPIAAMKQLYETTTRGIAVYIHY